MCADHDPSRFPLRGDGGHHSVGFSPLPTSVLSVRTAVHRVLSGARDGGHDVRRIFSQGETLCRIELRDIKTKQPNLPRRHPFAPTNVRERREGMRRASCGHAIQGEKAGRAKRAQRRTTDSARTTVRVQEAKYLFQKLLARTAHLATWHQTRCAKTCHHA